MECICLVLPPCLRPSQKGELVGFSLVSANTIFRGLVIEVAAISLCSGLTVCLPPRSFLPLQVKTHRAAEAFLMSEPNVRRYLRTHRICYPPDYRQLAERGLSPRKIRSFVGCRPLCRACPAATQSVLAAHRPNQLAHRHGHGWPPRITLSDLPGTE